MMFKADCSTKGCHGEKRKLTPKSAFVSVKVAVLTLVLTDLNMSLCEQTSSVVFPNVVTPGNGDSLGKVIQLP
jgi:hypothetical protein